jgi:hypothetical protein
MIDLETMGLVPGAAIVSIGAVVFDPRINRVTKNTFYRELDWASQGRQIDPNTQQWWTGRVAGAKAALDGLDDLDAALADLTSWLPRDCKPWGNGATFDISMLENAYRQHNIAIPWKFWNVRDCRTIKDIYESARGGYDKKSGGTLHHALDDAIFQAQYVCEMWKSILGGK